MRTKNGNDASITTRIYGTVHFVIGSGDEQFPCDRIRPERADMLDGTAGIHADIPQAGMGGTQPARDMVVAGFGDRRGDRVHRHQRPEHRGHRHHQPAGDHDRVGFGDRRTGLQRHRLAGSPHLGVLRPAEGRGADRIHPGKDGVDRRRLFQRHEDQMDSGQRGGARESGPRRAN